ncbi:MULTISPECIES: DegV family protein [unclassified Halanaerobium]|uniref:DegV family protein n=1 Tax=unclassified Halanaerobium TaxID=2641197 RepID=UPI000DF44611|nr:MULTISPECIES: DegV family protein [unclassified Halanaerobium]RCW48812.1 DegV family protein with EDD domain [Halanaerobium sp. MA284_MarDTE_T2]RCW89154.1 DegV family protein with EDD domain [Halanaerobium sp. DL-01]
MNAKIIVDSCCDLTEEIKKRFDISIVPLSINVNNRTIVDDEKMDRDYLLNQMKNSAEVPKTASPSPELFLEEYKNHDNIFVVTISSKLSSSYQNAELAKKLFLNETEDKFIHVFNSLSASAGETMIAVKIGELIEKNLSSGDIVAKVEEYISEMETLFVLDSLDNLIKAGRMNKVKGKIASFFSIKPILGGNEGAIELFDKVRGSKRAFRRLVEMIGERGKKLEDKILGIAHCNAEERAEYLKEEAEKLYNFRDIVIVKTAGISTVYANEGGVVIAF